MFVELRDRKVESFSLTRKLLELRVVWIGVLCQVPQEMIVPAEKNPQMNMVKQQAFRKMNNKNTFLRGGGGRKKCTSEEVRQVASQTLRSYPTKNISGHLNVCFWVNKKIKINKYI